jgi:hypothetical protein
MAWRAASAALGIAGLAAPAYGQLLTRSETQTNYSPESVVTADFNRDGKMDIAVASVAADFQVQVFLGNGDGTFGRPLTLDYEVASAPIAVGDLNNDGIPDLVAVNQDSGFVSVMLGKGDGTFRAPVNYATPAGPADIVLGDFNGDGNLDIATSDQYDNPCYCVSVLIGNGDGTFREPAIITDAPAHVEPRALVSGYFDGDKNLDLALAESFTSSGAVQIMLGNGDGTFRLGASYGVAAPELNSIAAADLRNNGKTDLVVGEFEGMGVVVLLGNGDGTFEQPVLYDISSPLGVATADFNGDGIPDIVASSIGADAGFTGVLLGKGDGTFGKATLYSTGVFPWGVATADFNGDHLIDVVVVDLETNQAFTLLNTGVVSFSPTTEITFKKQRHGTTSPPQTVTLTNTGKSSLKISSMKATGQFGMTTTCEASVAPGANCTIKVTFSPQTQGAKSGTVSIDDSASTKPQVIALSGDGT